MPTWLGKDFTLLFLLLLIYGDRLYVLKASDKTAQWVPVSTNSLQLRSDAATQTVGLFYPSQRHMNQKNDEMEQKLNAVKEMYERRPVVLTAVSPGKGQSVDAIVFRLLFSIFHHLNE